MIVTAHAEERAAERMGLAPKSAHRLAERAFENGLAHSDVSGKMHRLFSALFHRHKVANNIRVYGEYIYIFAGTTLITVFQLPHDLRAAARKLVARKRQV